MARYYCEYCHSYLTHDTNSVRKSHLVGKNHLRIVGDYYRNKSHQNERTHTGVLCGKAHDKRVQRRIVKVHAKESQGPIGALAQLYAGAPGYNKVFVQANRLDVRDYIKSSRVPQRANITTTALGDTATADISRNSIARGNASGNGLEPPKLLAQWAVATQPKQQHTFYQADAPLWNVVHHASKA